LAFACGGGGGAGAFRRFFVFVGGVVVGGVVGVGFVVFVGVVVFVVGTAWRGSSTSLVVVRLGGGGGRRLGTSINLLVKLCLFCLLFVLSSKNRRSQEIGDSLFFVFVSFICTLMDISKYFQVIKLLVSPTSLPSLPADQIIFRLSTI